MGIRINATIKSPGGGYNTKDYEFENQEHYDNWFDKYCRDHSKGKIIGIHKEEHF